MILVSACLAGFNCRYNGSNKENNKVIELVKNGKAIPICPEQLAGLPTPRKPVEGLINDKVYSEDGEDFTDIFLQGAKATLKLCKKYNIKKAILKSYSPSCGSEKIYNGKFDGTLTDGYGVTAKLLLENGIEIFTENDLDKIEF
jgi:Uncharacterized conserved protein